MGNQMALWNIFRKKEKAIISVTDSKTPVFDKKFKTILEYRCSPGYTEMVDWAHMNSSGAVDVKFYIGFGHGIENIYFGFEDEHDALIFRIKFL